ncbi:hypothetical protein EUGRSUZ_B00837 [Eucalyptus grandis]|uniref:Uncharacterized protein n=2 Tax=Eucalyptus grandis TaxID=71139 RepID=A0ACC3LNA6_EUCGR|nr:hypothetical protein EUGRSUZ_B00837 [Eucalyptus grandis]
MMGSEVETLEERLKSSSVQLHAEGAILERVDLATAVRFKIMVWKTKRYKVIVVGANVTLNDQAAKNTGKKNKDVKLKSGVGKNLGGCYFSFDFA